MDILIIGNGFDLAHGLKTSYKDFLEHCINRLNCWNPSYNVDERLFIETNLWFKHFITRQKDLGNTWIDLEKEIYDVIKSIQTFAITTNIGNKNQILPQLLTVQKDSTNFNFYEIYNYLKKNESLNVSNPKNYVFLLTPLYSVFHVYIKNPNGLINLLYDQLREFTRAFEHYLEYYILPPLNNNSNYLLSLPSAVSAQIPVLSFNYTDTCERLYKHKLKPIYIHGKVNNPDGCNLVLGTITFDDVSKNDNKIPVEFNIFQKHNQRHKYATIESYQDFLKKLTNPKVIIVPNFHIIGHSLDQTDHKILRHILKARDKANINIYYHNEEAHERLINNITQIIGEEEVMTKVRFIYQHDEKRGILKVKETVNEKQMVSN